jgi:membrane associated rhomboid family serine protease
MQANIESATIVLLMVNFLVSIQAFSRLDFMERMNFHVDKVLIGKEYHRLISAGFVHTGWSHLIFNMLALYMFARSFDYIGMSIGFYLLIYLASLVGGHALALFLHRDHGDYRSVGASGAVNGVIFAAIALIPGLKVWFIPGWIFGIIYMLVTLYGIKAQRDRVGHEAHLGGALTGLLFAIAYQPVILTARPLIILAMLLPAAIFLYLIFTRPEVMLVPDYFRKEMERVRQTVGRSTPPSSSPAFQSAEEEINHLLDKGIENLSNKERKRLEELSRSLDD